MPASGCRAAIGKMRPRLSLGRDIDSLLQGVCYTAAAVRGMLSGPWTVKSLTDASGLQGGLKQPSQGEPASDDSEVSLEAHGHDEL